MAVGRKRQRERKKQATLPKGSSYTNADFWISRNSAGRRMWRVRLPDFLFKTLLLPSCTLFTRLPKLHQLFGVIGRREKDWHLWALNRRFWGANLCLPSPWKQLKAFLWPTGKPHMQNIMGSCSGKEESGQATSFSFFHLWLPSVEGGREETVIVPCCYKLVLSILWVSFWGQMTGCLEKGKTDPNHSPLQILTHKRNYCF